MSQEIFDWLTLLGRWLHITVGVTWIGTSIFFMWLDRSLEINQNSKKEGHVGELWMVHGGGFYQVEKLLLGPTRVPEDLHWFKWESYWTWMSGIYLLLMIFYTGGGTFLLDSSVSHITYWQAVALGSSSIILSWFFYDFLWESNTTKKTPWIGHLLTLLWLTGVTYFLCHTLSGRAAYIHIGAMLGTWMTANVFLRIIPRQLKMVEASKGGQPVNQDWGKNAKNRSTHNTYFTLPVIFIMVSNHFPFTYGHQYNWLILLGVSAAGASIREFFIARFKNPKRSRLFGLIGAVLLVAVILATLPRGASSNDATVPIPSREVLTNTSPAASQAQGTGGATRLSGIVRFEGSEPPREKLSLPSGCSNERETFSNQVLIKDGRLSNVLVRISKGLEDKTFGDIPKQSARLDQKNCLYSPRVLAVRVGQPVDIVNSDKVFHNVRSISKYNEIFNAMMPKQEDHITKTFDKAELFLQTKCDVHPWMNAYIAVLEHPFFSVTNDRGEYEIANLSAGTYTLKAWHEVFGTQTQEFTIKDNEVLSLDFKFKRQD